MPEIEGNVVGERYNTYSSTIPRFPSLVKQPLYFHNITQESKKNMLIKISDDDARHLVAALECAVNPDFPATDRWNKRYNRLREKIEKAIKKELETPMAIYRTPKSIASQMIKK